MNIPTLLTINEAAAIARVSRQTITRAADRGEFRTVRTGARARRVEWESFHRWLYGEDWREVTHEH